MFNKVKLSFSNLFFIAFILHFNRRDVVAISNTDLKSAENIF